MNNLAQAIQFADLSHKGQVRKFNSEPYINHPVRVMQAVACDKNLGGLEEPAMAAVLHDVIEDCDVDNLYTNVWGFSVPRWVDELTHQYTTEAYPDKNRRERKALERKRLAGISFIATIIKIYDRIDNLESWFAPNSILTAEMIGFGRVYARESWDLMIALTEPELSYIVAPLEQLAVKLRDTCA